MSFWGRSKLPFAKRLSDGSTITLVVPKTSDITAARLASVFLQRQYRNELKEQADPDFVAEMERAEKDSESSRGAVEINVRERAENRKLTPKERSRRMHDESFYGLEPATLVSRCSTGWKSPDGEELDEAVRTDADALRDECSEEILEEAARAAWDAKRYGVKQAEADHRKNLSRSAGRCSTGKTATAPSP